MKNITEKELQEILANHEKWLDSKGEKGNKANLAGAILKGAYLVRANLRGADLWGAYLVRANLRGADLWGADLGGANLWEANLWEADLTNTILDVNNKPNQKIHDFPEQNNQHVYGYRYDRSIFYGDAKYKVGEKFTAPYFSTCETECHPGLYFTTTIQELKNWRSCPYPIIKVKVKKELVHKAGDKYRAKEFEVIGVV